MRMLVSAAALAAALTVAACSDRAADPAATPKPDAAATARDDGAAPVAAAVLDANAATAEQMAAARGMNPELAAAIVAGRPYASVSALHAKLRDIVAPEEAATVLASVFVPVNLNTASEADIKLIPGMSPRMVGEFLEYRPYADLGAFDREIGKYVDKAEVARLRNYVTL